MAEGHTIHALARRFGAAFLDTMPVASSPQGTFAGASEIDGRQVGAVEAYGKNLLVGFGDTLLHVHLGMFGVFSVQQHRRKRWAGRAPDLPVTGTVRLRLVNDTHVGDLRAPMLCRLLDAAAAAQLIAGLGPDPLRPDAVAERFLDHVAQSGRPIAELVLDQAVLAGVGNVYRAELPFRCGVDPFAPGSVVGAAGARVLWDDLVDIMPWGAASGRMLTAPDDLDRAERALAETGAVPRLRPSFFAYHRTGLPCRLCDTPIESRTLAGRVLYWCPRCQDSPVPRHRSLRRPDAP